MKTSALIGCFFICLAAMGGAPASAVDQPTIVLMGDDADQDTVARHSRVFNRVHAAMRSMIQEQGFYVYDETALSMDITNPNRVRRPDSELVTVARSIGAPPVDVLVIFQIYASAQKNAYADINQLRLRISGRLLQVSTSRALGNFEVAIGPKGLRPLPFKCNRDCVLERVGDEAKLVAKEVGYVLARKLDFLAPAALPAEEDRLGMKGKPLPKGSGPYAPSSGSARACEGMSTAYTITLDGYDGRDLEAIENMLKALRGYEHHRPIRKSPRFSRYWYETCSSRARLERNFRFLTEQLDGENRLALTGNRVLIERIIPIKRR